MNATQPIYTEQADCQDCYKCLRECPVKAIKVENGRAAIVDELCLRCGHCVAACPAGAKRSRNDVERAKRLLELRREVYVSLAPSYVAEFPELSVGQFVHAMKKLGFAGVSETALGAEEVSAQAARLVDPDRRETWISSACPAIVRYVKKYRPELGSLVTSLLSPALCHAKMLRDLYGDDVGVLFVGPCFAKKGEADSHGGLLDVALTFAELRAWWAEEGLVPEDLTAEKGDVPIPRAAGEGALYPIDGGMLRGIEACRGPSDAGGSTMTFSGVAHVRDALEDLDPLAIGGGLFLETLACDGGCVNGPAMRLAGRTTVKRLGVLRHAESTEGGPTRTPTLDIAEPWLVEPAPIETRSGEQLQAALREVGKRTPDDEMNCGGCGYDSCRQFAGALLDGRAERDMCVGYMRQLAAKKSDALIRAMPSGVVWVDRRMRIVECNRPFAELLGEEATLAYDACPGLGGVSLTKAAPFADLFENALSRNDALLEKQMRLDDRVVRLSVFTIEPDRLVGAVLQDVTVPAVQKEQIVAQAKAVVTRNLETVQKIAYLLGENAAESEVMLNAVIESFSAEPKAAADAEDPP